MPDLNEFILALKPEIRVALSTNAQDDLTAFAQEIPPERICVITMSFHPSQHVDRHTFLGKALLLKNRGFEVRLNFVAYPEQIWLVPETHNFFRKEGLALHIEPFVQDTWYPENYPRTDLTEQETVFLEPFITRDRLYLLREEQRQVVRCNAGQHSLIVLNEGTAYRCTNEWLLGKEAIGNIFDADFVPCSDEVICPDRYRCSGCDRDKTTVTNMGEEL
jgi:hypothetical protein